jgi:V8-like Glu-specific endopeptidase
VSHRLGSVIALGAPVVIGPDAGPATIPPDTWVHVFPVDPQAKFVMLHLVGTALAASDRVEVDLGYDMDVYRSTWGPDFWTRPVRGDMTVTVRYMRTGSGGGGHVTLDKYGRGEALKLGGADAVAGGNANADVFLLESPYVEPTYHYSGGLFPAGSSPSWENIACLAPGVMKTTARSVGIYIHTHDDELTSCTATLVNPDIVITAGHCIDNEDEVRSGSITFDFETDCVGARPADYNPKFYKLRRLVRQGYHRPPGDSRPALDYAFIQIETPPGGLGIPIVPVRTDVPPLNEPLFIIHHPRGSTKKVSRYPLDGDCRVGAGTSDDKVYFQCDIDNGSSGSSIFDSGGRIVANLSWWTWGVSVLAVFEDLATEPPPVKDVDVALVFDRSGSMSLPGFGGTDDKITEAKRAASLFVSLLRTTATHRVGLVSFSSMPALDFGLASVSSMTKNALIGPVPPGETGIVGSLAPGGMTTIGGGLQTAVGMFPAPGPAMNARAILLLTDGLENTPPMIATAESGLAGSRLNVIGFGTEASLDGPRLTRLAREHDGIYTRAGEGLALKKFFALAFGRIFDFPTSLDPESFLPADVMSAPPVSTRVCGERRLTAVLGWQNEDAALLLAVRSPAGTLVASASPGVVAAAGRTWAHLAIPLPFAGERDGVWQVEVSRPGGGSEFPRPAPATRFFVSTLVDGGPYLRPFPQPPLYTGDVVNPLVELWIPDGGNAHGTVSVAVQVPTNGTGNILTQKKLGSGGVLGGDVVDARTNTLIHLEQAQGSDLIGTTTRVIPLFDDGKHEDGGLEEDGIFGNPVEDLTRFEGNYAFHAIATFGQDCVGSREATWTVYVSLGIDPDHTQVQTEPLGTLPDGRDHVRVTITPRDRYGNYLGPGRGDAIQVDGAPGSEPVGGLVDRGDGSYTLDVAWDPDADTPPGVAITQPGRPAVVVTGPRGDRFRYVVKFICGPQPDTECDCAPVRPGTYATEVNIHNGHDREARIRKYVVPIVLAGAVAAREPHTASRKAADRIVLPPHTATMDDCCRLLELLLGASPVGPVSLTIGLLEIVSEVELGVTAVYTTADRQGRSTAIDVQTVTPT